MPDAMGFPPSAALPAGLVVLDRAGIGAAVFHEARVCRVNGDPAVLKHKGRDAHVADFLAVVEDGAAEYLPSVFLYRASARARSFSRTSGSWLVKMPQPSRCR